MTRNVHLKEFFVSNVQQLHVYYVGIARGTHYHHIDYNCSTESINYMECLDLLCKGDNATRCHPCQKLSESQMDSWRSYISLIQANWEDYSHSYQYYTDIREHPLCCTAERTGSCILDLVQDPYNEPKHFYDLT